MSGLPLDDKNIYYSTSLQPHRPHTMPRKTSLRLLTTTPNIPVPPSLRTSPYLSSSIFNRGFASSTLPSEEDERWLQDTIPLPSRQHVQASSFAGQSPQSGTGTDRKGSEMHASRRAVAGQRGVVVMQKGALQSPQHHHRRHVSTGDNPSGRVRGLGITVSNDSRTSNFVPPSMALVVDGNWTNLSAGLCKRRWSTGPLRPPNSNKAFTLAGN